jgi:UDP-N-acetylglucosamine/UDP-N-acetylgalactosamine diphosphorylase
VASFHPNWYSGLPRVVENNVLYMANLVALEEWYRHVRRGFFLAQEFGDLVYAGGLDKLALAKKERIKRLQAVAEKMPASVEQKEHTEKAAGVKLEFHQKIGEFCHVLDSDIGGKHGVEHRDRFLAGLPNVREINYLSAVQGLSEAVSEEGTLWLDAIIHAICRQASAILPSMGLFIKPAAS